MFLVWRCTLSTSSTVQRWGRPTLSTATTSTTLSGMTTRLIPMSHQTHSHVSPDPFPCLTRLIPMSHQAHSHVSPGSFPNLTLHSMLTIQNTILIPNSLIPPGSFLHAILSTLMLLLTIVDCEGRCNLIPRLLGWWNNSSQTPVGPIPHARDPWVPSQTTASFLRSMTLCMLSVFFFSPSLLDGFSPTPSSHV